MANFNTEFDEFDEFDELFSEFGSSDSQTFGQTDFGGSPFDQSKRYIENETDRFYSKPFGVPPTYDKNQADNNYTFYAYGYVSYNLGCKMQLDVIARCMPDMKKMYKNTRYGQCIKLYQDDTHWLNSKATKNKQMKIKFHLKSSELFNMTGNNTHGYVKEAEESEIKSDIELYKTIRACESCGGLIVHRNEGKRAYKGSELYEFSGLVVLLSNTDIIKGMTFYFGDKECEYTW